MKVICEALRASREPTTWAITADINHPTSSDMVCFVLSNVLVGFNNQTKNLSEQNLISYQQILLNIELDPEIVYSSTNAISKCSISFMRKKNNMSKVGQYRWFKTNNSEDIMQNIVTVLKTQAVELDATVLCQFCFCFNKEATSFCKKK